MRKLTLALSAAALAVSGAAFAQTAPAPRAPKADTSRAEAMAKAEAAFARVDVNSDGKIDAADRTAMESRMFERLDTNRDGSISKAELAAARAARPDRPGKRPGKHDGGPAMTDAQKADWQAAMFARADTDGNGAISRAELDALHAARGDRQRGPMADRGKKHGGPGGHHRMMASGEPVTRQAFVDQAMAHFDRADTDRNGTLTQAERKAARETMRQHWQARKAQGQG